MSNDDNSFGVQYKIIDETDEGQRIDNYLFKILKGVPKSRVYRLLRKGEVRINGRRIAPPYRLQKDDKLRLPPLRQAAPRPKLDIEKVKEHGLYAHLKNNILYENLECVVFNKPAGMAVHGGSGLEWGLIEIIQQLRPDLAHAQLVHRLDRDTSGCLVVAKNRESLVNLQKWWKEGLVRKTYIALLKKRLNRSPFLVKAPLRKYICRSGEHLVSVDEEGQEAFSEFLVKSYFKAPTFDLTLVEAILHTGRTHQLRVHSAHIGHPIGGDEKYGDHTFNRWLKDYGKARLFLHAHTLILPFPDNPAHITAPLTPELKEILKNLAKFKK